MGFFLINPAPQILQILGEPKTTAEGSAVLCNLLHVARALSTFYSPKHLQKYKYFLFMICRYEPNTGLSHFFSLLILVFILKLGFLLYLACLKYGVYSLNGHCNHNGGQLCGGSSAVIISFLVLFSPFWGGMGRKSMQDRYSVKPTVYFHYEPVTSET